MDKSRGRGAGSDDQSTYVVELDRVDARDLARAGGKASNLGELVRAGFPVPPGFVVTTAAYDSVVAEIDLKVMTGGIPSSADAAALRACFETVTIPPEVERAILAGYRKLGGGLSPFARAGPPRTCWRQRSPDSKIPSS